ncbi:MAG: flagellin [Immundisolibacteraceae bacterium]|nr:flagellin [Immundisolibacteraceae bacterium]
MANVINTNVLSLNAQRNLNTSQNSLATSIQRLSSGLRINSARDDAAGLAISDRMTSQIRGFNQASRNAADAVSLSQVGEGALQQVTNNLQRMRELAIQSTNATNTAEDRISLDAEFQQLLAANDELAKNTAFNGRNVLDGSLGNATFQVGANVGETISVDVSSSMRNTDVGRVATTSLTQTAQVASTGLNFAALTADAAALDAGDIQIGGVDIGAATAAANGLGAGSSPQIVDAINALTGTHGATATANATTATITASNFNSALNFTDENANDTLVYTLEINGTQIATQGETPDITTQSDLISLINSNASTTGVTATLQSNNDIALTASDGRNIEFAQQLSGSQDADTVTGFFGNTLDATGVAGDARVDTFKGTIDLVSAQQITVTDVTGNETFFVGIADAGTQTTNAAAIASANVLTVSDSNTSIRQIDQAIRDVDTLRGTFGAIQTRFESTIASLATSAENLSAARSRIQDTDFAAETAELTRSQILQQAGTAMLAQANSSPQSVLSLLQ